MPLPPMYVIYDVPTDHYAVRLFHGVTPAGAARNVPTLELARALLPEGAVNIGRTGAKDPTVVEVWLAP